MTVFLRNFILTILYYKVACYWFCWDRVVPLSSIWTSCIAILLSYSLAFLRLHRIHSRSIFKIWSFPVWSFATGNCAHVLDQDGVGWKLWIEAFSMPCLRYWQEKPKPKTKKLVKFVKELRSNKKAQMNITPPAGYIPLRAFGCCEKTFRKVVRVKAINKQCHSITMMNEGNALLPTFQHQQPVTMSATPRKSEQRRRKDLSGKRLDKA